jgi:hypothetical protein
VGVHDLCGRVHSSPTAQWFCTKARTAYQPTTPRRTHDEVVQERDERRRIIAARREFNARRRAEQAARKAAKGATQ